MTYFPINVTVIVEADSLEEAQETTALFMPWTTGGSDWHLTGHKYIPYGWKIDQWIIDGVDSDEMEAKLREKGYR
jgi:hypothetical protein